MFTRILCKFVITHFSKKISLSPKSFKNRTNLKPQKSEDFRINCNVSLLKIKDSKWAGSYKSLLFSGVSDPSLNGFIR